MALRKLILLTTLPLLFAGCVNISPSPDMSATHPANPAAAQATYPPLAPFLMADTNLVVMTTTSIEAPVPEDHHDAKPEPETHSKHDHH